MHFNQMETRMADADTQLQKDTAVTSEVFRDIYILRGTFLHHSGIFAPLCLTYRYVHFF